jgi:NnrS protein
LPQRGFGFFLLGAAFAAAIVPVWMLVLLGVGRHSAYLDAASWHAHEMVFGFALAASPRVKRIDVGFAAMCADSAKVMRPRAEYELAEAPPETSPTPPDSAD